MRRLQLPAAVVQGMWMRSTIKLAPPATGPTSGTVGTVSRPPLLIAVVGDSTAAGCGVNSHHDGFAGALRVRSPRVPSSLSIGRQPASSEPPRAGSATGFYRSSARTSMLRCSWPAATTS
jgi:hypothetical protein